MLCVSRLAKTNASSVQNGTGGATHRVTAAGHCALIADTSATSPVIRAACSASALEATVSVEGLRLACTCDTATGIPGGGALLRCVYAGRLNAGNSASIARVWAPHACFAKGWMHVPRWRLKMSGELVAETMADDPEAAAATPVDETDDGAEKKVRFWSHCCHGLASKPKRTRA